MELLTPARPLEKIYFVMETTISLRRFHRVILLLGTVTLAVYSGAIAAALLLLREEVREQILQRDAQMLGSVADHLHQRNATGHKPEDMLDVALESSEIAGVIGVSVFNAKGEPVFRVPASLESADLNAADLSDLNRGRALGRHYATVPLSLLFSDIDSITDDRVYPLNEVLAPLTNDNGKVVAVLQYWLDGREVAAELAQLDVHLRLLAAGLVAAGAVVFLLVFLYARQRLLGMGRLLAERNRSLAKANADLALAARTSAIGSVSSHLFHGLKNPLAGLKTYLRLTGQDEEAVALTERMQALIDETLAVLRSEPAEMDAHLDGAELLQWIRQRIQLTDGPTLEIHGHGEGSISGHKARMLLLVLRNLIDNAADATGPDGHISVDVNLHGDQLEVEVADNGPGLPDRVRDRLFQPMQSAKANGSGIGLAISATIARHLPAELTLKESGPRGTTFTLKTLP